MSYVGPEPGFNSFPNMSHVPPTRVLPGAQEMKKQQAKLVMGRQGTVCGRKVHGPHLFSKIDLPRM